MAECQPDITESMHRYIGHELYRRRVVNLNTSGKPDPLLGSGRTIPEMVKDKTYGQYIQEAHDTFPERQAAHRELARMVGEKVLSQPDVELDDYEVRILYRLDADPAYSEDALWDNKIRMARRTGTRDRDILATAMPELIREQLTNAYVAYKHVSQTLGIEEVSGFEFEHFFGLKEHQWQQDGTYQQLAISFMQEGSRATLVATPNVEVDVSHISNLAAALGDKKNPLAMTRLLYTPKHYSNKIWSGNKGDDLIHWSLIPDVSRWTMELSPAKMKAELRTLQKNQPDLNFHAPSLLEAITHWYALRAAGKNMDRQYTRVAHFDQGYTKLPDTFKGPGNVIPLTWYDNYDKQAVLGYMATNDKSPFRIAL